MNTSGFGKASMIRARIALMEVSAREDGVRLEVLHRPLEEAILAVEERLKSLPSDDEEAPWVSSIVEDESAVFDELIGIAFVIVQTYLTNVKSHIVKLSEARERLGRTPLSFFRPHEESEKRPGPNELLRKCSLMMKNSSFTEVEVLNAVANYWKHRDEWTSIDWTKLARPSKDTAARVQVAGIQPTSTGNLCTAAKAFGVVTYHDLEPIRVCALAWAEQLVTLAKSECEGT